MRIFRSFILAIACLALLAGPTLAETPTVGAARWYAPGTTLTFRFGVGSPAWVQQAVRSAASDFSSLTWNNSRTPTFSYSAAGPATFSYSGSFISPCGTGNRQWLQCSANWGAPDFHIYIRDFSGACIRPTDDPRASSQQWSRLAARNGALRGWVSGRRGCDPLRTRGPTGVRH
jgi:hypothetical protein